MNIISCYLVSIARCSYGILWGEEEGQGVLEGGWGGGGEGGEGRGREGGGGRGGGGGEGWWKGGSTDQGVQECVYVCVWLESWCLRLLSIGGLGHLLAILVLFVNSDILVWSCSSNNLIITRRRCKSQIVNVNNNNLLIDLPHTISSFHNDRVVSLGEGVMISYGDLVTNKSDPRWQIISLETNLSLCFQTFKFVCLLKSDLLSHLQFETICKN